MLEGDASARDQCVEQQMGHLADRAVSQQAVRTLAGIGVRAVKSLIGILRSDDEWVRANAIDALGRIAAKSPEATDAVAAIVRALTDRSVQVRRQAAGALGRNGIRGKVALAALEKAEEDSDQLVRELAAVAKRRISANLDAPED
jgi:HEAT repeat protein